MLRGGLVALVGVVLVGAAGLIGVGRASTADACSRDLIRAHYIPGVVEKSGVVAIAEVTAATERVATFRVEEALKGSGVGALVRVDNRTAYTGSACSPYDEPFGEGFRFRVGDRKILILEKEVDGLWQVAFGSDTAWNVPSNELQPLIMDFWVEQTPKPKLGEVRREVANALPVLGDDLGFEARGPCNVVQGVTARVASSTLVVIAEVESGSGFSTVRILEVLAGEPKGESFTLNHRTRRDYETCDVRLEPPAPQSYLQFSGRQLLYLREGEFGLADYRPTFWGFAHEDVNDLYVTHGLPTLQAIRRAAAGQPVGVVEVAEPNGSPWWPGVAAHGFWGLRRPRGRHGRDNDEDRRPGCGAGS